MNSTFKKEERLKSKKSIADIFENGKRLKAYPLAVRYVLNQHEDGWNKVAFSVPKRKFKRAVDRNRIKRQVRECYRLNKHILKENNISKAGMIFIYIAQSKSPYSLIEKSMIDILNQMGNQN